MSEASEPPQADPSDLLAALGPLRLENQLRPSDFTRHYEGYLTVAEINRFDDLSWLEVRTPDDLKTFRDGAFRGPAREMPPIIVVTYPVKGGCRTEIRDG